MKLSQLYCSDSRFKPLIFNDGFNLIIGSIHDLDQDTHNLGKSSLVTLINFMLLKSIDKHHVFKEYYEFFEEHTFFLELKLNSGLFLTIKRSVKNNTKISFNLSDKKENFINCTTWDETDLSLANATNYLNSQLAFNVLENYSFRTFLHYFLKDEKSYNPDFSNKIPGPHENWKAPLLDLLGIDSTFYKNKLKDEKELKDLYEKNPEKENFSVLLREKEAQKKLIEKEIERIKKDVESFDYYTLDKSITQEAVETLVDKISHLNEIRYKIEFDIKKLSSSLNGEENVIDLESLNTLFEEVNLFFPDQLKKNYSQLVEFNKKLFSERQENISKTLEFKSNQLKEVDIQLTVLNLRQKELLKQLKQNNIYLKVLEQQQRISKQQEVVLKLTQDIEILRNKEEIITQITSLKNNIRDNINQLERNILKQDTLLDNLVNILQDITQNIFENRIGIFNVPINSAGNPDFTLGFIDANTQNFTAEEKGGTYGAWLDACFNISIIASYADKSFFRFVFQDSILEKGDNRRKHSFINEIKKLCTQYNLQFITTAIEHELYSDVVLDVLTEQDTILKLDDRASGEGTLYGFLF